MLQLANETPMRVVMTLMPDRRGVESLVVLVKGTFSLDEAPRLLDAQLPLQVGDVWRGDPGSGSLRLPNEYHPPKPSTDVLLYGHAHTPDHRPRASMEVSLRVGPVQRVVRVWGDREFTGQTSGQVITAPQPFAAMPLCWERAYGGRSPDGAFVEARNPVGVGALPDDLRRAAPFRGAPVPNLEDPADPFVAPGRPATPVCFAPVAPTWAPRSLRVGTYDDAWDRARAPFLPDDFDDRHYQCAPDELVPARPLAGAEPIALEGLSPRGAVSSRVPQVAFDAAAVIAGVRVPLGLTLDTLCLEPDEQRMSVIWRVQHVVDKRALSIASVRVALRPGGDVP